MSGFLLIFVCMKIRFVIILTFIVALAWSSTSAQERKSINQLDALLIQGEYDEVVSNCLNALKTDSLNAEIYYKLGIAYQNLMLNDKTIEAFSKALKLAPDNKKFMYTLARYYYNAGKLKLSQPILDSLCTHDSLNWMYSFYLSDIYMQKGLYSNALPIYQRFHNYDTTSTLYIDKLAFCNLRMGNDSIAIKLFEKSLSINSKNIPSLKNLSYLYLRNKQIDTAVYQLNQGLKIDSTDADLYYRRAEINYSQNYHYRARPDYLRVLELGDSSKLVLKKIGIGLAYNDQPNDALDYLLKSFQKDSNDFETTSYIGQSYYKLKQYKKSIKYYNKVLKLLSPITKQIEYSNSLLADSYKDSTLYDEAVKYYTKSLNLNYNLSVCIAIANIYDDKLKNNDKAIYYYQLFLNNLKSGELVIYKQYIDKVKERLDWLIKNRNKKR